MVQNDAVTLSPTAAGRALRVVREHTEHARWEMVSAAPPPALAGLVDGDYCGWWETSSRPFRRLEVPSSIVPLILNLGPPLLVVAPGEHQASAPAAPLLASFTAGMSDAYALTESHGTSYGVQVNLTPLAAYRALAVPMHRLKNRVVPLESVLGAAGAALVERLGNTAGWSDRFDLLDEFLLARLVDADPPAPGVAWAWDRLQASGGRAAIRGLAEQLGWSHRRLIAGFREHIGLTPKTAARVLRFHGAVSALRANAGVDWADVAYGCGYFDQSHLIRDFAEFAGTTPTDFRRRILPAGGGVLGE